MSKTLTMVFGIIFVIVGILGFISNPLVGPTGYFETNSLHSIVHLLIGIIMVIVAASAPAKSATTLKTVGVIYLLLAIIGFIMIGASGNMGSILGVLMSSSDNWLHLVLGIVILGFGLAGKGQSAAPMATPTMTV